MTAPGGPCGSAEIIEVFYPPMGQGSYGIHPLAAPGEILCPSGADSWERASPSAFAPRVTRLLSIRFTKGRKTPLNSFTI